MSNSKPTSKQTKNKDNKILKPSTFLETEKAHKDWYDANQMGKQGGKPVSVPRETRKTKSTRKHSLRKEK